MAPRTPEKREDLIERLRAALAAHDAKLGKTYCGCSEHRALRQAVIDAARELLKGTP